MGQNLRKLGSLVKQVGSRTVEIVPCGEELPRLFPGVAFEIPLHLAWLNVTVVQRFINGSSRRARASSGAVEDRSRGRRRGGGVLH